MKNRSFIISCLAVAAGLLLFACSKADTDPIESKTEGETTDEIPVGGGWDPKLSKQSLTFPKEGGTEVITAEKSFSITTEGPVLLMVNGQKTVLYAYPAGSMSVWNTKGYVYDPTIKVLLIKRTLYNANVLIKRLVSEDGKESFVTEPQIWARLEEFTKTEGSDEVFVSRIEGDWFTIERSIDDYYTPVDRSLIGRTSLIPVTEGAEEISAATYADQLYTMGNPNGNNKMTITVKPNTTGAPRTLGISIWRWNYMSALPVTQE